MLATSSRCLELSNDLVERHGTTLIPRRRDAIHCEDGAATIVAGPLERVVSRHRLDHALSRNWATGRCAQIRWFRVCIHFHTRRGCPMRTSIEYASQPIGRAFLSPPSRDK